MTKSPPPEQSLLLLLAVSITLGWRPLLDTFTLALREDQYTHIILILPLSAALILSEWRSLRPMVARNFRTGFPLLVIAVLLVGVVKWRSATLPSDVRLSIEMFALVLSWIAAFVLCFGSRVSRSVLFPLCFLFGLVPFPQVVLNEIVDLLQQGSAIAAYALFVAVGVPATQNGILVTIPGLTVEVAQECSSIRSSSMLLVTTMVLAHVLLRSPWRKLLAIVFAVFLSVAKNGLRIFTIAMLGTRVDPAFLTGRLHRQGGIVFFMIALIAVFVLLWIFRKGEKTSLA
ncbi:MAG: exosortase/archaeosortase family protein [Terriglobales bacterium]